MACWKMTRFLPVVLSLVLAAGCRPTDPQPVATLNGEKIMSATCTNSIVTPTEQSCKRPSSKNADRARPSQT